MGYIKNARLKDSEPGAKDNYFVLCTGTARTKSIGPVNLTEGPEAT